MSHLILEQVVNIISTQWLDEMGTAGIGDLGGESVSYLQNGIMAENQAFIEVNNQYVNLCNDNLQVCTVDKADEGVKEHALSAEATFYVLP